MKYISCGSACGHTDMSEHWHLSRLYFFFPHYNISVSIHLTCHNNFCRFVSILLFFRDSTWFSSSGIKFIPQVITLALNLSLKNSVDCNNEMQVVYSLQKVQLQTASQDKSLWTEHSYQHHMLASHLLHHLLTHFKA